MKGPIRACYPGLTNTCTPLLAVLPSLSSWRPLFAGCVPVLPEVRAMSKPHTGRRMPFFQQGCSPRVHPEQAGCAQPLSAECEGTPTRAYEASGFARRGCECTFDSYREWPGCRYPYAGVVCPTLLLPLSGLQCRNQRSGSHNKAYISPTQITQILGRPKA